MVVIVGLTLKYTGNGAGIVSSESVVVVSYTDFVMVMVKLSSVSPAVLEAITVNV